MQIGITLEPVNIGDPEYPYFAMVFAKNKEKYCSNCWQGGYNG